MQPYDSLYPDADPQRYLAPPLEPQQQQLTRTQFVALPFTNEIRGTSYSVQLTSMGNKGAFNASAVFPAIPENRRGRADAAWVKRVQEASDYFSAKGAFGYTGSKLTIKASASGEQKRTTDANSIYGYASVVIRDSGLEYNTPLNAFPTLAPAALSLLSSKGPLVFQSTYGSYFILSTRKYTQLTNIVQIKSNSGQTSQQIQASLEGNYADFMGSFSTVVNSARSQSNLNVDMYVEGSATCSGVNAYNDPVGIINTCYTQLVNQAPLTEGFETVLMRFSDLPSYSSALSKYKGGDRVNVPNLSALENQTAAAQAMVYNIWARAFYLEQTAINTLNNIYLSDRGGLLLKEIGFLRSAVMAAVVNPPRSDAEQVLQNLQGIPAVLERSVLWVDRAYKGCFATTDSNGASILPVYLANDPSITTEKCVLLARNAGLRYAGLSNYAVCTGGLAYPSSSKLVDTACNLPCSGGFGTCGGTGGLSTVYDTGCEKRYTGWQDDGTWVVGVEETEFLDRHDIQCNNDEALRGFHLERQPGAPRIRYEYHCCKVSALAMRGMKQINGVSRRTFLRDTSISVLNDLPIGCDQPGALLQQFKLNTYMRPNTLWKNCAVWNEARNIQHNDWCENDLGANWWHWKEGAQQADCWWGQGKGMCVFPFEIAYSWRCLAYAIDGKKEVRKCRYGLTTPYTDFITLVWLDRHFVMCGDDELLTSVKWITVNPSNGQNLGQGYYRYNCCTLYD
eukprot:jgi/Botrbrau1/4692/Bobra.0218s0014.1